MNYEWLFSFVAFADRLNFTRAAEDLHLSQPALHVQVRKLGESIGVTLYRRKGRGLELTGEGKRLAAFGRSVKQQGREVLGELRGEDYAGPIVLASGQGAFLYLLGGAIRRFPKNKWPLRLLTLRGPDSVTAVRDGKAHLAVAVLDNPPADLSSRAVRSVGQLAVVPKTHRLAGRRRLRPDDLDGEPLVAAPAGSPHRTMLEHALRAEGVTPSIAVEATGWALMLEFARDGMGLAVVNDFCPVPRGCVGIELRGVPRATYYMVNRGQENEPVSRLQSLICAGT